MRELEVIIHDIAFGGAGVGRLDGKTIFVPLTIESERVLARPVREKKRFTEAELTRVLDSSPHRVTPGCPYFGECGGCSYQHIAYAHQLEIKMRQVEQTLRRIGGLDEVPLRPIISSPREYAYRNRITVHVDQGVIGFYRMREHRLLDIERCPISHDEVNAKLDELRARRPPDGHYTLRRRSGARVFEQTNDEVAPLLLELVKGFAPARGKLLIDAYCGSGFFARGLAEQFEEIIGIEWDRYAVDQARAAGGPREQYVAGDVGNELDRLLLQADPRTIFVIVDPPATGLDDTVRATLLAHPVQDLVYVSCNPATLARDLSALRSHFTLESVTPVDMFPQTAEIEVVARFRRTDQPE